VEHENRRTASTTRAPPAADGSTALRTHTIDQPRCSSGSIRGRTSGANLLLDAIMPSIQTNLLFFSAALLLAFAPGPDNVFVLMQSASQGRKAGIFVVLGLCTGLLVHTAAVTFGLAAIFAACAAAFTVLKFVGAGYLAYLAWQAYRAPVGVQTGEQRTAASAWRLYTRGIVMNLTNPKVVLFFVAFLPQFVRPEIGSVALQLAWFGFLFIVSTLIAFSMIAYLAGYIGERLRRSENAQRFLNRSAAFVFAGLALRLVTSRR